MSRNVELIGALEKQLARAEYNRDIFKDIVKELLPKISSFTKLHGRLVLKTPIPEELEKEAFCADCGNSPKFLITEIGVLPKEWDSSSPNQAMNSWFWCGSCDKDDTNKLKERFLNEW